MLQGRLLLIEDGRYLLGDAKACSRDRRSEIHDRYAADLLSFIVPIHFPQVGSFFSANASADWPIPSRQFGVGPPDQIEIFLQELPRNGTTTAGLLACTGNRWCRWLRPPSAWFLR